MRRLSLSQLLKNAVAYTAVSAAVVDAGLLLTDRTTTLGVPASWYINGPLLAWTVVGIPVSINLAGRLLTQITPNQKISGYLENTPSPHLRTIPFFANGRQAKLLAHTVSGIFGASLPTAEEAYRPAVWQVPIEDNPVLVRESELRAFLEVCYRRTKYQFSRNYWLEQRRPPLIRQKYEAFMRLLVEAGLVEGRHAAGGASGRLVTHPRFAVTYLKFESPYAVVR